MSAPPDAPSTPAPLVDAAVATSITRTTPFAPAAPRDAIWRHGIILVCAVAIVGAAALLTVRGEHEVQVPLLGVALPELCYWRSMLGLPCPGCGLTRCFISLAHGDLARAWHFQPVGCLLFAGVLLQFPYRSWQILRLRRGATDRAPRWLIVAAWLLVPALFVQWLWRLIA